MPRGFQGTRSLQPHRVRSWLTPAHDEPFEAKVAGINGLYAEATAPAERRERVPSTDEMSGVQALERLHPSLPMEPGLVERRESESTRHGTQSLIVSRDVAPGRVVAPSCGPTPTEADLVAHLRGVVATDPEAVRRPIVTDDLNIHGSGSLVRDVAELPEDRDELGVKGESGLLKSMKTRAAFLSEASRRIVLHDTPEHASGMNQAEIRFSILARKVPKRGNVTSVEDQRTKVLAFIASYNRTMAKPQG